MHNRIRAVRKALNLSQREFGESLGVSRDVISNIEYGRVPPKEPFLIHLCQQCRVNRHWLDTGEGDMFEGDTPQDAVGELIHIFNRLCPDFQSYAFDQIKKLAELQTKDK